MIIIARDFVHIHGHTKYSEKDAITDIPKLVAKVKERGMKAIAVTDHGHMFSMVKTFQECQKHGIKYIPGTELYYTEDRDVPGDTNKYHIVILAKTNEGLINLYKLSSDAGLNRLPGKSKDYPRTDDKALQKYGKGLVATSACLGGIIPKLIAEGRYDDAKAKALFFATVFDEFYLEVQPHEISEQLIANQALVKMSQETGIPLVVGTDYHYIEESDKKYHDILMAMGYRSPYTVSAHLRTAEEVEEFCINNDIPLEAMDNTVKIADGVDVDPRPSDSRGLMPQFPCPEGYTEATYLRKLAFDGLMEMVKTKRFPDLKERIRQMNYELDVICSMGFAGYFLILWDWFKWCRENGILMGKGRGSAAGSLVSYSLKITTIDPIKNGYYFERFLNPERIEFPDVDSDISKFHRAKAIEYLLTKYGSDYVAQIITFSELRLKSTIKGVMSAFNLPFEEANEVTKQLPDAIDGNPATLEYLMDIDSDPDKYVGDIGIGNVSTARKAAGILKDLFSKYPIVADAVEHLTGCIAGTGIHAGGVIVSGKKLNENIPLIAGSDTAVLPLVQINMDDLGFFNALKIDALGLSTLSQVRFAMDLLGLDYEWFDSEDFSDPEVYKLLRDGFTTDIFQMAGTGATKMIRDMNVESFEEITDVNAGNRPGPLSKDKNTGKSLVDNYIENKRTGMTTKTHPDIDTLLAPTKGCLWYQEQCMALGQILAGYSLGAADIRIRKVLGKKQVKKIPEIENEFIYGKKSLFDEDGHIIGISDESSPYCAGALSRGYDKDMVQHIFDQLREFSKYSFNKAHSGAYAALAYKTAWLKRYHPVEWAIACLKTHDKIEKIVATISDCKRMGIEILPPDINESEEDFTIVNMCDGSKAIRYGLSGIKGVGARAVEYIKRGRPYKDFEDFYTKVHSMPREKNPETGKLMNNPIDKRVETAMIQAGVFDMFEENRYKLMNDYMIGIRNDKNFATLDAKKFNRKIKLQLEKELMGMYISEHPLDPFPYEDVDGLNDGDEVEIAGIIKTITTKNDRRGNKFAVVVMETKDGKDTRTLLQSKVYEKYKARLVKGEIIIVGGTVNKEYNNISCDRVRKLVRKVDDTKNQPQETADFQHLVRQDPNDSGNPVDQLLQFGG